MTREIEVLAAEIESEPEVLKRLAGSGLNRAPPGSIFVGAGDSYAAALAGFYASEGKCIALDPYSLAAAPEVAEGLDVFFVSASGRTVANVRALKEVAGIAKSVTAVTADPESPLAELARRVVRLPMGYAPKTPGLLSFSLSLLAVLMIARGGGDCDFAKVLEDARRTRVRFGSAKGTTYFLGNSLAYPVAMYAAAKMYELLGARAHAELLDEFSHLELFSLGRKDVVNALSCFDPSRVSVRLCKALSDQGYEAHVIPSRGRSKTELVFHSVFAVQLSVVAQAKNLGLSRPKFLDSRDRLRVSDAMIY